MHSTSLAALVFGFAAAVTAVGASAEDAASPAHPVTYRGYSGVRWPSDFQVRSGHCDRQAITASPRRADAIASLGMRRPLNRTAALLVGAHVSDLIPPDIGAEVDEGDRACMGQVLELGASGHKVRWDNGATGVHYEMWPDAGRDGVTGSCRAFHLRMTGEFKKLKRDALACETGPGLWQLSGL